MNKKITLLFIALSFLFPVAAIASPQVNLANADSLSAPEPILIAQSDEKKPKPKEEEKEAELDEDDC